MSDHAARYRRQTYIRPDLDLDGERESKLFLFYQRKSCVFFLCCQHVALFSQLMVLVSVRNVEADFAWHSYVICFQ